MRGGFNILPSQMPGKFELSKPSGGGGGVGGDGGEEEGGG